MFDGIYHKNLLTEMFIDENNRTQKRLMEFIIKIYTNRNVYT